MKPLITALLVLVVITCINVSTSIDEIIVNTQRTYQESIDTMDEQHLEVMAQFDEILEETDYD